MRRLSPDILSRMAERVSAEDRDEMAIPSYLHRNPAMRWMAWKRLEVVANFFRNSRQGLAKDEAVTVMDFGCGTGVLFDQLSGSASKIYGVDLVLEPAELLVDEWQLDKVTLMKPERAAAEIASNSIDVIVAAEVLEHIDPVDDTLAFFHDRLRENGTLLVSLPTESLLYRIGRRLAGFHGHYHESDAATIHQQILTAGFREIQMQKIPAPGPLAIYWVIAYQPL
jgi:2-polyprenyl-3-methyl-5-hydroxy-6-metoxy-1,4-benzoquinol methylase